MPVHLWNYGNRMWIYLFPFHADTCLFSTNSSIWIKTEKKWWQLHTDTAKLWICGWTALPRQTGIWLFQAHRNTSLKLISNTHFTCDVKLLRIVQLLLPCAVFLLQLTSLFWVFLQVHCCLRNCPGQLTSCSACHPPAAQARSWNSSAAWPGLTSRENENTVFKQLLQKIVFYIIHQLYFLFNHIN